MRILWRGVRTERCAADGSTLRRIHPTQSASGACRCGQTFDLHSAMVPRLGLPLFHASSPCALSPCTASVQEHGNPTLAWGPEAIVGDNSDKDQFGGKGAQDTGGALPLLSNGTGRWLWLRLRLPVETCSFRGHWHVHMCLVPHRAGWLRSEPLFPSYAPTSSTIFAAAQQAQQVFECSQTV